MHYFLPLFFTLLIFSGCGNSDSTAKATETILQPQVKDATLKPPAPPSLD